jgi:hypothetical protein
MAHNHHHHAGGGHVETEEDHIHSEANVDLYMQVGHTGFLGVVLATYFMWFSNSHTAFGDVLHGVADVSTVYLMAYLAYLHKIGKISKERTNRLAGMFNTALLILAALGVWLDLQSGHRQAVDPWKMGITAGILLVSNIAQFYMMHKMHGHEHKHDKHVSMFSSTVQHLLSDIVFDVGALFTAGASAIYASDAQHLDEYVALILIAILVVMAGKNIVKLSRNEELDLH